MLDGINPKKSDLINPLEQSKVDRKEKFEEDALLCFKDDGNLPKIQDSDLVEKIKELLKTGIDPQSLRPGLDVGIVGTEISKYEIAKKFNIDSNG